MFHLFISYFRDPWDVLTIIIVYIDIYIFNIFSDIPCFVIKSSGIIFIIEIKEEKFRLFYFNLYVLNL